MNYYYGVGGGGGGVGGRGAYATVTANSFYNWTAIKQHYIAQCLKMGYSKEQIEQAF